MATIQSSISLMDGMTRPLHNILSAMNTTISTLHTINNTSVNIDTSHLAQAQQALVNAGAELTQIQDSIQDNINKQNQFNESLKRGESNSNGLFNSIKKLAIAYLGIQSIKKGLELSDELTQNKARLNLFNDGNQSTEELQNMIYQSSKRSRGDFLDTFDATAKMGMMVGNAFGNNKELVGFMELINKQFKISGTSAQGAQSAMFQLTQAMTSGVLRGEDLNSVLQQAPMIIKNIADYMNIPMSKVKDIASQGKITSEIVKNAMFAAGTQINEKFESIPRTFGDSMTYLKNNAIRDFSAISSTLSDTFNSERFQNFINGLSNFVSYVIRLGVSAINMFGAVGGVLYETWGIIQPFAIAVLGMFTVYKGIMTALAIKTTILNGTTKLYNMALVAKNTILGITNETLLTTTAAQWGLNAAMLECPITWIVVGIGLVIAALYAGVAAFNKLTSSSVSATGIIVGAVYALGGIVYNVFAGILNCITSTFANIYNIGVSIAELFMNVFKSPIKAVGNLFLDFINFLIDSVKSIASILDTVLGTDTVGKIESMKSSLNDWMSEKIGENDIKLERLDTQKYQIERVGIGDMYNKGYDVGSNFKLGVGGDTSNDYDLTNELLGQIAMNTASTNGKLDMTTEEIKYLRDVAEMEAINKFTTAEVKVEVGGITNNVASTVDVNDIFDGITNKMAEGLAIAAEGVYD